MLIGANLLGLDDEDATKLFCATSTSNRDIVKTLRGLANTGVLDPSLLTS